MIIDGKPGIFALVEMRLLEQCEPIAAAAAEQLKRTIDGELQKLGVKLLISGGADRFAREVQGEYTRVLLQQRLNALVDQLTAPAVEMVEGFALGDGLPALQVGDYVTLNSGGPTMKVTRLDLSTDGVMATCEWAEARSLTATQSHAFPVECLTPAPRSKIPHPTQQ